MNPGLSPSEEQEILCRVAGQLASRKTAIISEVHRALQSIDMANRMLISPSRLKQIAHEETEAFLSCFDTLEEEMTRQRGAQRASEGLGERCALAMTEVLRRACWTADLDREALCMALQISGRYTNAFLEGYIRGREEDILRQQELTLHAFQRLLEKQTGS